MANEIVNWPNGKGGTYPFHVFQIALFHGNPKGNYIFARKVNNGWEAVYIGEGDINERIKDHVNNKPLIVKGATHIHIMEVNDKETSFQIETELLEGNTEAYEPTGCNVKKGG